MWLAGEAVASRGRHGASQIGRFADLPDSAVVSSAVAEAVLGCSRSTVDKLRKQGRLETRSFGVNGRGVRIVVGSIRRALEAL
jgi:hypothetical protein